MFAVERRTGAFATLFAAGVVVLEAPQEGRKIVHLHPSSTGVSVVHPRAAG